VGGISYYNQYPDMEYRDVQGPDNTDGITLGQPPAPRNLYAVHYKSLTLRGYMVRHHVHLREEAHAWLIPHLRSGALRADEQLVDGFEHTVGAFLGVLRGDNVGKTIVQIANAPSHHPDPGRSDAAALAAPREMSSSAAPRARRTGQSAGGHAHCRHNYDTVRNRQGDCG
jgi:hypothetical protein